MESLRLQWMEVSILFSSYVNFSIVILIWIVMVLWIMNKKNNKVLSTMTNRQLEALELGEKLKKAESLDSALKNAGSGKGVPDQSKYNIPKPDEFTGDLKLSCEAVLCLSTSSRPSECNPAIRRYFSIKKRKMSDTIRARRDFLNICPASKEDNMPELINALANGAGRCDAAELNRVNRYTVEEKVCKKGTLFHNRNETFCEVRKVNRIRNAKPSYCSAYFDHGWTQIGTRYVGDEKNGGKWVD